MIDLRHTLFAEQLRAALADMEPSDLVGALIAPPPPPAGYLGSIPIVLDPKCPPDTARICEPDGGVRIEGLKIVRTYRVLGEVRNVAASPPPNCDGRRDSPISTESDDVS